MTDEAPLLAACARAMRGETASYETLFTTIDGPDLVGRGVYQNGDFSRELFAGTAEECRAWIAQRAFAAGLRVLAESEVTTGMAEAWARSYTPLGSDIVRATADLHAMLGALLEGSDDVIPG